MPEHIQVRENVYASPKNLQIIKENGWEHLYDMAQEIDNKVNLIHDAALTIVEAHTSQLDTAMSQEQKEQWHSKMLVTLTQINQALFSVECVLQEQLKK